MNRVGRPTDYTEDLAKEICLRLANGELLIEICKDSHMPHRRTVQNWAHDPKHEFFPMYMRARADQAWTFAEEMLAISDDRSGDFIEHVNKRSGEKEILVDHDHISRSRLKVDTRKFLVAKLNAKIFGDEVRQKHMGPNGEPLTPTQVMLNIPSNGRDGRSKVD